MSALLALAVLVLAILVLAKVLAASALWVGLCLLLLAVAVILQDGDIKTRLHL